MSEKEKYDFLNRAIKIDIYWNNVKKCYSLCFQIYFNMKLTFFCEINVSKRYPFNFAYFKGKLWNFIIKVYLKNSGIETCSIQYVNL